MLQAVIITMNTAPFPLSSVYSYSSHFSFTTLPDGGNQKGRVCDKLQDHTVASWKEFNRKGSINQTLLLSLLGTVGLTALSYI